MEEAIALERQLLDHSHHKDLQFFSFSLMPHFITGDKKYVKINKNTAVVTGDDEYIFFPSYEIVEHIWIDRIAF